MRRGARRKRAVSKSLRLSRGPLKTALDRGFDVVDFRDPKEGGGAKIGGAGSADRADQPERFREKRLVRPIGKEPEIRGQADAGEEGTRDQEFGEGREQLTGFEQPGFAPHQPIENREIDQRDAAGGERETAMSEPELEGEKPVEQEVH